MSIELMFYFKNKIHFNNVEQKLQNQYKLGFRINNVIMYYNTRKDYNTYNIGLIVI